MTAERQQLPPDLIAAIHGDGLLTAEQLQCLISAEASWLGLTFVQAVALARRGALPKTALGSDVDLLIRLLD